MNRKSLAYGSAILLICTLSVLGVVGMITRPIYQEPLVSNISDNLEAPPSKFKDKHTVETVAAQIGATGISQPVNVDKSPEDILVSLSINGELVDFGELGPRISQGVTMVPVKEVFSHLGFEITWNEETKSVSAIDDDDEIVLTIGQMLYLRNDEPLMLDAPAKIIDGKTMIPLRVILDCLGAEFEWLESDKLIKLVVNR